MNEAIIAAGHLCLDITPVLPAHEPYKNVGDLLSPGKLIRAEAAQVHTGGSVGNTGLALKALGADVRLMGKMGDDAFGALLKERLGNVGRDVIVSAEDSTSYTVVLAIPGLDRIFLHNPGANDTFRANDIPGEALKEAALIHFGYPPLMREMMRDDGAELHALFTRAHAHGTVTSLDLAAVDPHSEAGKVDWRAFLKNVLPVTDIFTPSFEELLFMLDRPRFDALTAMGGDMLDHIHWEEDIIPLGEQVMALGAKILLLKCGTKGLLLKTADAKALEAISERMTIDVSAWAAVTHCQPCYPAEVVRSATGAGDVTIAAFLLAMLRGHAPVQCAQLAAMEGACSVTTYDALSGLKPLETLIERL